MYYYIDSNRVPYWLLRTTRQRRRFRRRLSNLPRPCGGLLVGFERNVRALEPEKVEDALYLLLRGADFRIFVLSKCYMYSCTMEGARDNHGTWVRMSRRGF